MNRSVVGADNNHVGTRLIPSVSSSCLVPVLSEAVVERAKFSGHDHFQNHHTSSDRSQNLRRPQYLTGVVSRFTHKDHFLGGVVVGVQEEEDAESAKEHAISETKNEECSDFCGDTSCAPHGVDVCGKGDKRNECRRNISKIPLRWLGVTLQCETSGSGKESSDHQSERDQQ